MIRAIFQIRWEPILHHTRFQVGLRHSSSGQCIQTILAVSMVTNTFLYSVVLSRRHNCISLLFFKSWQVVTWYPLCSTQNWRIWSLPSSIFPLCTSLNISCVVSEKLSFCSLSCSCSLAITYSSCTFSLSSELSSSIVKGGFGCVAGLSNKAKFVSVTCVEEISFLLGLTDCPWAVSVTAQFIWWLFAIPCKTHRFTLVGPGSGCHVVTVPSEDQSCCFSLTVDMGHDVRSHFVIRVSSTDWRANGRHPLGIFCFDRNPKYGIKLWSSKLVAALW